VWASHAARWADWKEAERDEREASSTGRALREFMLRWEGLKSKGEINMKLLWRALETRAARLKSSAVTHSFLFTKHYAILLCHPTILMDFFCQFSPRLHHMHSTEVYDSKQISAPARSAKEACRAQLSPTDGILCSTKYTMDSSILHANPCSFF
jgi:hypothetical protein